VNYVNQIGALWIGNGKDILVPFKEARPMEKGKRYLVYLYG
jgi:predicted RNA-binding protein (virulence factor B family)